MPHIVDTEEFIEAESLKFDFKVIRTATDDFSQRNKLGQGGFGGVYKVCSCNYLHLSILLATSSS